MTLTSLRKFPESREVNLFHQYSSITRKAGLSLKSVAFSPDGKTLASGSQDKTIILWNVANRKSIVTLKGHTGAVESAAWSPDGKTLASASDDKTVRLWKK